MTSSVLSQEIGWEEHHRKIAYFVSSDFISFLLQNVFYHND